MLFPSTQPSHIPSSTVDSQYDTTTTTTGYSSSFYTRWPRSLGKTYNTARNSNSTSRRHHHYQNKPCSDILHYQYGRQQQPIYSTLSPQRSSINNILPMSNDGPGGSGRQRNRHSNWSSLGSLNSFGESTTTPPSSQEHTGSSGSNTNGSGQQRETLHSRFDFKQTLGKGTYGKVKLALDKRKNEQVAIKTIKKSRIENPHDLARIRREIDFMTSLNHPYIIKVKEVYESREKIILVMEYASGGELYDYLNRMKRIPESQARAIFRQIVSAVHFLHKNQIVHRDLKLENILIDHNGDIKLADFGLSNSWSPRRLLHTFCGSPLYASPEIVSGIPYYGPEVDCWSLGVLLYTLVFGSMPFQGGDYNRLVRNITSGDFIQPREQSGSLGLIRKCLTVLPSKRFTIDDVATHWWVNLGYKYPPVHYYLTPAMKQNGMSLSSDKPAISYDISSVKTTKSSSKTVKPSAPVYFQSLPVQNGHKTDTQMKSKPIRNGYNSIPRTNRLITKTDQISKTSRRTSKERYHGGALTLIQHCLKSDANNRATTKDILHHKWLTHGPVLSVQLTSTTTASSISFNNQQTSINYDTNHLRSLPTTTTRTTIESSLSPTNSLVELELHTSSFFDTARLRDNSSVNKDQQRRNRVSAIPISTRYLSSNNTKIDPSLLSRPTYRRPVSLSIDDQYSTNEKLQKQSVNNRNSQQTLSLPPPPPTPTTYDNNNRYHSLQIAQPLTLPLSSESTTIIPSTFLISNDFDLTLNDLKSSKIYKYITPPKTEFNITPYFPNSTTTITTTVAPSVFTTSAIKFVPVPTRRMSPLKDQENNSSTTPARLFNNTISNPSYNNDNSINIAPITNTTTTNNNNNNNSEQLLTTLALPTSYNTHKNRLLDDNNNLVSLKVYE
ncbi:unnamed protein product [Rotaria sordida]|uniref:Protein kinase domain-containing protein n=1 Tax=Rotaria sordida TaxID=392033 RepID=A0A814XKX1_9BILA|nr:unnamed protein product [Rotaria sordida]CAF1215501.1 unnamed protein product [Rotaria sordida]